MKAGFSQSATALGTQIGRYFSITAVLPSVLFVTWLIALRGGAAPFGHFDLDDALNALTSWSAGKLGVATAAALLLGLVVHPLLFATTQLLEGYWGPRLFAVRLAGSLALRHRRRQRRLQDRAEEVGFQLERALDRVSCSEIGVAKFQRLTDDQRRDRRVIQSASPEGEPAYHMVIERDSINKALLEMPLAADRILPTRLGNALRRVEDTVGQQYGLDLIAIAPHVTTAADPTRTAYVDDTREQMDLAVRLAFFGLLSACVTTVWLLGAGWWLLLSLIPYAIAYLTYRGAVAAAADWGAAIATCIDLDRFALYEAMHLPWPADTTEERLRNSGLMKLVAGDRGAYIRYMQKSP